MLASAYAKTGRCSTTASRALSAARASSSSAAAGAEVPAAAELSGVLGGVAGNGPALGEDVKEGVPVQRKGRNPEDLGPEFANLIYSLRSSNPSSVAPKRAWDMYVRLATTGKISGLGPRHHRLMLRHVLPRTSTLQQSATSPDASGKVERHLRNQERLRFVLDTMTLHGVPPNANDFEHVLALFAAVGSRSGVRRVMDEMRAGGVAPRARAYNLVFEGYVRWLRYYNAVEDARPADAARLAAPEIARFLSDMSDAGIRADDKTVSLALRVLKECADYDGFSALLRSAYGVDLENPDHAPLEFLDAQRAARAADPAYAPPRVSTHVLNSVIDFLGKSGRTSLMIAAFETLTQPLPSAADPARANVSTYTEADEDALDEDTPFQPSSTAFFSSSSPASTPSTSISVLPAAPQPNTTTYKYLITHASAAHGSLTKHYVRLALASYLSELATLRAARESGTLPLPQPHLHLSTAALQTAFTAALRRSEPGLASVVLAAGREALAAQQAELADLSAWHAANKDALPAGGEVFDPASHISFLRKSSVTLAQLIERSFEPSLRTLKARKARISARSEARVRAAEEERAVAATTAEEKNAARRAKTDRGARRRAREGEGKKVGEGEKEGERGKREVEKKEREQGEDVLVLAGGSRLSLG